MSTVTDLEAKTRLSDLLNQVACGEEVIITRNDKPVARLIPEGGTVLAEVRRGIEELRALREAIRLRTSGAMQLSDEEVRAAIAEGRP